MRLTLPTKDLFLVCKGSQPGQLQYQIWLNDKTGSFVYSQGGQLPSGAGAMSFADMGWFILSSLEATGGSQIDLLQIEMGRWTWYSQRVAQFHRTPAPAPIAISTSSTTSRNRSAHPELPQESPRGGTAGSQKIYARPILPSLLTSPTYLQTM